MTEVQLVEEVANVVAEEATFDCVGLWAILWEVKQRLASPIDAEAETTTLAVIRQILLRGAVLAGDFVDVRFVPWRLSPDEVLQRIESEWSALGREPTIGDIVWFVSPAAIST